MSFPKTARLLSRFDYKRVRQRGTTLAGKYFFIDYYFGKDSGPKLGLTVSRRFGNAIARNRFKRVVREAFRCIYSELPYGIELNIRPRVDQCDLTSVEIAYEIKEILKSQLRSTTSDYHNPR